MYTHLCMLCMNVCASFCVVCEYVCVHVCLCVYVCVCMCVCVIRPNVTSYDLLIFKFKHSTYTLAVAPFSVFGSLCSHQNSQNFHYEIQFITYYWKRWLVRFAGFWAGTLSNTWRTMHYIAIRRMVLGWHDGGCWAI